MLDLLRTTWLYAIASSIACVCAAQTSAEIVQQAADGFQIQIKREVALAADEAYSKLVGDFASWWDASHSYTGDARNLSMNIKERCMLERLPDGGFVRHMEVLFHQPGKALRLGGGLGPLQDMGVDGVMAFSLAEADDKTALTVVYTVNGAAFQQLDSLAGPVNQVLTAQIDRWQAFCNK